MTLRMLTIPLLSVVAVWPLAVVASYCGAREELTSFLTPGGLVLPAIFHALPSTRRRGGGCLLGFCTWIAMGLGVFLFYQAWPEREWETPGPRALNEELPCKIGGLELRQTRAEIDQQLGTHGRADQVANVTVVIYPSHIVHYFDGRAQVIYGPNLEQGGRVLISLGDDTRRLDQVFSFVTTYYQTDLGTFYFDLKGDRVTAISGAVSRETPRELKTPVPPEAVPTPGS